MATREFPVTPPPAGATVTDLLDRAAARRAAARMLLVTLTARANRRTVEAMHARQSGKRAIRQR